MDPIVRPDIEDYASARTTPEPEMLQQVARETEALGERARMLTGRLEGRLLNFLVGLVQPAADSRDRLLHRLLGALDGGGPARRRAGSTPARSAEEHAGHRPARTSTAAPTATASSCASPPRSTPSPPSMAPSASSSSMPTRRTTPPTTKPSSRSWQRAVSSPSTTSSGPDASSTTKTRRPTRRPSAPSTSNSPATTRVESVMLTVRDGLTLVRRRSSR